AATKKPLARTRKNAMPRRRRTSSVVKPALSVCKGTSASGGSLHESRPAWTPPAPVRRDVQRLEFTDYAIHRHNGSTLFLAVVSPPVVSPSHFPGHVLQLGEDESLPRQPHSARRPWHGENHHATIDTSYRPRQHRGRTHLLVAEHSK